MIVWGEESRLHELQAQLDTELLAQRTAPAALNPEPPSPSFQMRGLFGLIPKTSIEPLRLCVAGTP